ncbi:hypothetical protein BJ508DRAFT_410568 [Ascobolus immersus RN42]|uniref:Uncharacterized protein n=1 Tax=Ascobolus immersus RN42 TaxID=1160509 RepID=A0A3N4ILH2_ASCIM|nr:hypothetical protein BJ508DRAFT_410568 [Ascobolus immersus RN42]
MRSRKKSVPTKSYLERVGPKFPLWDSDCTHISPALRHAVATYCTNFSTLYAGFDYDTLQRTNFLDESSRFFKVDYPIPLRAITDKYLLFFLDELLPYSLDQYRSLSDDEKASDYSKAHFSSFFSESVSHITDYFIYMAIKERIKAGLFREAQGRLIEIALSAQMDHLRTLMKVRVGYDDLYMACSMSTSLILFLSEFIRSARIENTILKYLEEDGVDLEVARAVEQATLDFNRLYHRLRGSFHEGGAEELRKIWPRRANGSEQFSCMLGSCLKCARGRV